MRDHRGGGSRGHGVFAGIRRAARHGDGRHQAIVEITRAWAVMCVLAVPSRDQRVVDGDVHHGEHALPAAASDGIRRRRCRSEFRSIDEMATRSPSNGCAPGPPRLAAAKMCAATPVPQQWSWRSAARAAASPDRTLAPKDASCRLWDRHRQGRVPKPDSLRSQPSAQPGNPSIQVSWTCQLLYHQADIHVCRLVGWADSALRPARSQADGSASAAGGR